MKKPAKKRRKPGPPRRTGPGELIGVRIHAPLLRFLDEFCEQELDHPTRAEALRRLASEAIAARLKAGKFDD